MLNNDNNIVSGLFVSGLLALELLASCSSNNNSSQ
jgi:hypothetical protein